jgi:hypothetical protein
MGGVGVHNTIHTYNQFGISFNMYVLETTVQYMVVGENRGVLKITTDTPP